MMQSFIFVLKNQKSPLSDCRFSIAFLYEMAIGEYHDTHEYDESCDDFHRRRDDIVEHIIEDKTCERESKLKDGGECRGNISQSAKINPSSENVRDKYEEENVYRIDTHLREYF